MDSLLARRKGFRSLSVAGQTQAGAAVHIQPVEESLSVAFEIQPDRSRLVGSYGLAVAEAPVEPLVVDAVQSTQRSQSSRAPVACSLSWVPLLAQTWKPKVLMSHQAWLNLPICSVQMEQHALTYSIPSGPGTLFGVSQNQGHSNHLRAIVPNRSMRV